MSTPVNPRAAAGAGLAAAVFLLLAAPVQLKPGQFFQDDAYFYLQIASHLAAGHGSTFHEITPTNGYHPLWMALCVIAFWLAGGSKAIGIHVVTLMQTALFLGAVEFYRRIAGQIGAQQIWPGAALLASYLLATALYGSEAHLNAFTFCAGLYLLLRAVHALRAGAASEAADRRLVSAGFVLGLAILSRLDNVFVVGTVSLSLLLIQSDRSFGRLVRSVLLLGLPIVAVVLPYLVYNLATFGHAMPISGAIKGTFPAIDGDIDNLGTLGKGVGIVALFSLALAALDGNRRRRALIAGMASGVLLHAAYVVLFTDHYTFWPWYYVSGVINASLTIAVGLELLAERIVAGRAGAPGLVRVGAMALALGLAGSGIAYAWAKAYRVPPQIAACRWPDELGRWMKGNLPASGGVLVYDWPGALAFHSDLPVLPADGLVNDFAYNDDIVELGISQYLCRAGVTYYFGPVMPGPGPVGPQKELQAVRAGVDLQELEIFTPIGRRSSGRLRVLESNRLVAVRDVVSCPDETPQLAIWRLSEPCR